MQMAGSNFIFLQKEYPILYNIGVVAEYTLNVDPITSLLKLRQFGEKLSEILLVEHKLNYPTDDTFHNRIKTLEFENVLPITVIDFFFLLKDKGNIAVNHDKITNEDCEHCLFSAFKLAKWFYESYSLENKPIDGIKFTIPAKNKFQSELEELEIRYNELETQFNRILEERKMETLSKDQQDKFQSRSIKAANKLEMSEAETRDLIDAQLVKAGWLADTKTLNFKRNKTQPRRNKFMAIAEWPAGNGWADYALFIGNELYGIVEAKKYEQDISTDLRQSKIYAEQLIDENETVLLGQWQECKAPFLFSTNGRAYLEQIKTKSGIWFLDVRERTNTSRPLQGWYSPEGLIKLYKQDIKEVNKKLASPSLDFLESKNGLSLRKYQIAAIKAIEESIVKQPHKRRALIAMATGTGKTRTIIGLCYHLIQTGRFNRILFLVDRNLLGTQTVNAFKDNKVVGLNTFAEVYDIKELKEVLPEKDTRLQFSTVQSMVKRLFYNDYDENLPSVDQYDCIIVDEAHRGYLLDREMDDEELTFKNQQDYVSKYRKVLDYFDAYAIALTATPALHTKEIFGSPVYFYSYREAVIDGYLIDHEPPYNIETKLSREGIKWAKGERPKAYDRETNSIVELEKLEDELRFDVSDFNKLVLSENFNRTVIETLVKELDPDGEEKTLIFAATDEHADAIVQMLKEEFINLGADIPNEAIQKITGKSYNPQELLTRFKNEKFPNIAVTVDLLTTGIDVPAICNLVFLRRVKSRILYEQMLGRATRRCDEIGKEIFKIYDAVKIYDALADYTQMKPVVVDPKTSFQQLVDEIENIQSKGRLKEQVEQIIARLQRKKRFINESNEGLFKYRSGGYDADGFIGLLSSVLIENNIEEIISRKGLWHFLDELRPTPAFTVVSEHEDEWLGTTRGYGNGEKPEDYLDSFSEFIKANLNKIDALQVVCSRPKDLDRKSLRQLLIALDNEGYNTRALQVAWRDARNENIAADIISFIRTLAVGNSLVSHEQRIKNAVNKVRKMKDWTGIQSKWIDRFEKQLLKETILQLEDLNAEPFKSEGGFQRLNKIFGNQLQYILNTINDNLYAEIA
jgi:type I restriction enzyme R subunit